MTNIKKTFTFSSALTTMVLMSPLTALAQDTTINLQSVTGNLAGVQSITFVSMVSAGINFLLIAAALIAFFFLLAGGVQWILAGGDKEGTEKARKKITNALIGLAIVFSAYAIAFLVNALFGVNILSLTIKPISSY